MPAELTETTEPHGLVLGWADDGTIFAKLCFRTVFRRDGVRIGEPSYSAEMTVAEAVAQGFPVADAIAVLQAAVPPG